MSTICNNNHNNNEEQSASPFGSPIICKERSNSIQLSLGNGMASIYLPITFSQDNIIDLMNLANKFEIEEEENDDFFESNESNEDDDQLDVKLSNNIISLSHSSSCSQTACN